MKIKRVLRSTSLRAKVLGIFVMAVGIYLIILRKDPLYQKIGFGAVFIGAFIFLVITEKTIPKKINDAQMISNMELLHSLVNNLDLKGNGIYIPAGGNLSKERVFIPTQEEYNPPTFNDDTVFAWEKNGSCLGVVFVPPGLELLETYEREMGIKVKKIDIDNLKQYLQIMIYGLDLIKDLSIERKSDELIRVKIKHSAYKDICKKVSKNMGKLYLQTGCPICSSILCAVTRALGKKVRIHQVDIKDNDISYLLKIGG